MELCLLQTTIWSQILLNLLHRMGIHYTYNLFIWRTLIFRNFFSQDRFASFVEYYPLEWNSCIFHNRALWCFKTIKLVVITNFLFFWLILNSYNECVRFISFDFLEIFLYVQSGLSISLFNTVFRLQSEATENKAEIVSSSFSDRVSYLYPPKFLIRILESLVM